MSYTTIAIAHGYVTLPTAIFVTMEEESKVVYENVSIVEICAVIKGGCSSASPFAIRFMTMNNSAGENVIIPLIDL